MTDSFDAQRIARLEFQVANLYRHLGLDPDAPESLTANRGLADAPFGAAPFVDAIPPEFSAPPGPVLPPGFDEAVRRGNTIAAIKIYREATGLGLAEAKHEVEAIIRRGGR